MINHELLRSFLIREKPFLKELYEGNLLINKKSLQIAEDYKLKTLIYYLHFLSKGEISITRKVFEKIPTSLIKLIRKKLELKSSVTKFLSESRSEKIKFLNRLAKVFCFLLYPLFNEI